MKTRMHQLTDTCPSDLNKQEARLMQNNEDAHQRGFTIIELMIVVAIVAILAAVALPNYTQYVRRSNRADAQTTLLQAAQFLERRFTTSGSYVPTVSTDPVSSFARRQLYKGLTSVN